jgi:PKD domain
VSFSGAADVSAKDTAAGFKYAFACDGSTPLAADAGPASSKNCSFAQNGTKTVKGIVVDKDGDSREYSTNVVVNNANPVLAGAADQTALEGTAKSFELGSFTDAGANDNPWKVSVNWGDGTAVETLADRSAAGQLDPASHTYKDNGTYPVAVTVTDKDGGKDTKTFMVAVANVAPKITQFSGTDYLAGSNAYLSGGAGKSTFTTAFTDPGADTWTGLFTYSDGSPLTESVSPMSKTDTRTHTFASAGCKSASVKVTDDDGGSDTASTTVKVGTGGFQPPMTNQPVTDKLRNGQVLPVKVRITDCAGAPVTTLAPAIRLVKGDLTPQSDDTAVAIAPTSSSAADTTGVMRSQGGGDYLYNMQVNLPSLNTDYTVVIYPYGTSSPVQLGHVVQATK